MKPIYILLYVLLSPTAPLYAAELSKITLLNAEQWEVARADAGVRTVGALAETQQRWSLDPTQLIELHYPGGEEGELWVSQLINWFVALGIPSSRLVAVPGSGRADVISLRVIQPGVSIR